MTALQVRGLVAGYGTVPAVHHLDLTIHEGEIVALLGPNGAGKTTTLHTIAGLQPRIAGDITLFNTPLTHQRPHDIARLGLALVPEHRGIFHTLTTEENLRLRRRRGKTTNPATILGQFPALTPLLTRRAGLLSGGEQQMLALAAALTTRPRFIMIDEMSHGLAPIIVEQLLPILTTAAHDNGTTILLVEQHTHTALEIADRAYILNRGHLTLHGTTDDLRQRPHDIETSYLDTPQT